MHNIKVNLLNENEEYTAQSFLSQIIEPALCQLTQIPFSREATQLLLGTALKESGQLKHRKQIVDGQGSGPAGQDHLNFQ